MRTQTLDINQVIAHSDKKKRQFVCAHKKIALILHSEIRNKRKLTSDSLASYRQKEKGHAPETFLRRFKKIV